MDCGQGKVKEKGPNFWQGFILWLKYAKSSFSGAFRRQPERSAMGGRFEPGCSLATLARPWFLHLKKKKERRFYGLLPRTSAALFLRRSLPDKQMNYLRCKCLGSALWSPPPQSPPCLRCYRSYIQIKGLLA